MAEYPAQLRAEIEKYERKHEENPRGRNFVPLANAYRKAGELQLAEGLLRDGIRLHPDYLSAHIVLGRVLADQGASAEAAAEFRHVLSVDPQNLIALRTMGELAVGDGRADEAGYWFRELLVVDPMNDEARVALADLEAAPSADEEFEGGGDWWQGDADPELEDGAASGERVDANALPEPHPDRGPDSDAEPRADRDPEPEPYSGRDGKAEDQPGSVADDAAAFAEVDAEGGGRSEEGTAVVAAGHHPIAPTHESLLGEPAGAEDEPREPVDGDLVESAAWDAPPAEYEIDAPPGEPTPSPGGAGDELASETLAELYARQGFTEEAARMYRELIRRRGEEPHLVQRLSDLEGAVAADDDSDASPHDAGSADAAWSGETDSRSSSPESPVRGDHPEQAPSLDDSFETAHHPTAPDPSADPFADSFTDGFGADDEPAEGYAADAEGADDEPDRESDDRETPSWLDEALAVADDEEDQVRAYDEDHHDRAAADDASLRGYFRALLAWRPGEQAAASAAPEPGDAPGSDAAVPFDADDHRETEGAPDDDAAPKPSDDEPFPWELPADEPSRSPDEAPAGTAEPGSAPAPSEEGAGDRTTPADTDTGPAWSDTHAERTEPRDEPAPQADGDAGTPDAPRQDRWSGSPAASKDEDDDDLESFQAWLRSLKR